MSADADEVLETARRVGIEADATETRRWLLAIAGNDPGSGIARDDGGVFGDRVALLDFDPDDLDHLRRLAPLVRFESRGEVESALAISGSSAQGRVQLFPGDKDFFERVHIRAATRDDAARILRELMRATALRALADPDVVLVEANLGVYPVSVRERGVAKEAGDSITWTPADVEGGVIVVETETGDPLEISWDDLDVAGGWVYLGWIVADREAGRIALASNMIDATWEDPNGEIASLDGAVDPLAQEVYLEASALPLVERLGREVAPGAREAYRDAMRGEARHYTHEDPSYADHALDPDSGIDRDMVLAQLAVVREAIAEGTDGEDEAVLLADLQELEDAALRKGRESGDWATELADVRTRASALVNEFFRTRLLAHDRVREIVDELGRE